MAAATPRPKELDPAIAEAILSGLAEDIASGRVEVQAFERIDYRGARTLIVHYVERKGETGGKMA